MMKKNAGKRFLFEPHPLIGTSLTNWRRLIKKYGPIDLKFLPQALVLTAELILLSPFRFAHKWMHQKKIQRTAIHPQPIFILGFWRSGTTFLHSFLVQDPQWGYVTQVQAYCTQFFAFNATSRYFDRFAPKERPMDHMKMGAKIPDEHILPVGNLSVEFSEQHGMWFPQKLRECLQQNLLFEGRTAGYIAQWKKAYAEVLQGATYAFEGRPLVLKNPGDTALIKYILELFPQAKFITIHRNPYFIYASSVKMFTDWLNKYTFQNYDKEKIVSDILFIYEKIMQKYFAEKSLIPADNLIEIKFEDLEKDALGVMQKIYQDLCLPNYEQALPSFQKYVASLKDYKKNSYHFNMQTLDLIKDRWGFAINQLGYAEQYNILKQHARQI